MGTGGRLGGESCSVPSPERGVRTGSGEAGLSVRAGAGQPAGAEGSRSWGESQVRAGPPGDTGVVVLQTPGKPLRPDPRPVHPSRDSPSTDKCSPVSGAATAEAVTEPGSAGHAPLGPGARPSAKGHVQATGRTRWPHSSRQPAPTGSGPRSPAGNSGSCRPRESREDPHEVLGRQPAGPTVLGTKGDTTAPGRARRTPRGARAGPPAEKIWAATARKALVTAVSECGDTFSCRATLR